MAMNMQEISDRMEINNLLIDYCSAIDGRRFDELDNVFTADAFVDYTCFGGPKGSYPEIKEFLMKAMVMFPSFQHMIGNSRVRIDGDKATARTICHNPMTIKLPEGGSQVAFYGLWYVDKLVRTESGWRLCERIEEPAYTHNLPAGFQAVEV